MLKEKNLADCNFVTIPMKTRSAIELSNTKNYKKADIKADQYIIKKLIYLLFNIKSDITFVVKQLNKWNANASYSYFK